MRYHGNDVIEKVKKHTIGDGLPVVADLQKSHGSWVHDQISGRDILDCYSMHAGQPLGWNHPRLADFLEGKEYVLAHKVSNPDLYTPELAEFVAGMAEVTPDFKHLFFIDGGTLAVENALKVAFDWKARKTGLSHLDDHCFDVVHFREAFHGRSGYTLSLTNTGLTKTRWFPQFQWTRVPNPKITFPLDADAVSEAEGEAYKVIHDAAQKRPVAAIIIEPIQGEGGDNHFRPTFHQNLRTLADHIGAMLIYDEVQTGLGMTGRTWAYQHYGIVPDIICFGKKTQVAGIAATDRVDTVGGNCFTESGRLNSTWGGNLCDMVRATAILKVMKKLNLVQKAEAVGNYMMARLGELGLANLRGKGLMVAWDMPNAEERDDFLKRLSPNMLALKSGERSVRLRPHLTFSMDEADLAQDFISQALDA